jgi:hypothetical protein
MAIQNSTDCDRLDVGLSRQHRHSELAEVRSRHQGLVRRVHDLSLCDSCAA